MSIPMDKATLHDYFAGQAVQGILAGVMVVDRTSLGGRNKADEAAFLASAVADSMMVLAEERHEADAKARLDALNSLRGPRGGGSISAFGDILPLATLDDEP